MGLIGNAVRGAAAGLVATIPMTAVMVLGERATGYGKLPPEALVTNALDELETDADQDSEFIDDPEPDVELAWRAAHLAAGAAFGALYAVVFRPFARIIPAWLTGPAFGLGVWRVSYQNVAPALELLPPADLDDESRQTTNVLAHLVYGGVLGTLLSRQR